MDADAIGHLTSQKLIYQKQKYLSIVIKARLQILWCLFQGIPLRGQPQQEFTSSCPSTSAYSRLHHQPLYFFSMLFSHISCIFFYTSDFYPIHVYPSCHLTHQTFRVLHFTQSITRQIFFHFQSISSTSVVQWSDYKSAGLISIPDKDSRRTAHSAVHSPKQIGR